MSSDSVRVVEQGVIITIDGGAAGVVARLLLGVEVADADAVDL